MNGAIIHIDYGIFSACNFQIYFAVKLPSGEADISQNWFL